MSQITTLTNHRSPQNQPHYFIRTHHLNRRPLCWSHQNKGSINQGCHKRFYRHMFFWFIYILPFETSATASCGYMLFQMLSSSITPPPKKKKVRRLRFFGAAKVPHGGWNFGAIKCGSPNGRDEVLCLSFNRFDDVFSEELFWYVHDVSIVSCAFDRASINMLCLIL